MEKENSLGIVKTQYVTFKDEFFLESGRILSPVTIAYETYGTLNDNKDNVILVCHALTGSAHAAGLSTPEENSAGWWDAMIGPGKTIDTDKYFVICSSVIGSPYGSTSPISPIYGAFGNNDYYRFKFPLITIQDMVKAIKILLNALGIMRLHAIIGGSMGGMQTLSFAILYPKSAKMYIPIAMSYASNPQIIAINKIMSEIIRLDSAFKNGKYEITANNFQFKGLEIARMLGFMQYLSLDTMQRKFGRNYVSNESLFDMSGRFEIERYLDYNGANFTKSFDPLCYLYLIRALSVYDAAFGFDNLKSALSMIQSPLHLIGFLGDNMFPINEMQYIKKCMDTLNKICTFKAVDSNYGHDAFLVEIEKYGDYVQFLLDNA